MVVHAKDTIAVLTMLGVEEFGVCKLEFVLKTYPRYKRYCNITFIAR